MENRKIIFNKKAAIKASIILFIFIIIGLLIISIRSNTAFTLKNKYLLGEMIKIDLGDEVNYNVKIESPKGNFFNEGRGKVFFYKPDTPGNYSIIVNYDGKKERYYFEIVENIGNESIDNPTIENNLSAEEIPNLLNSPIKIEKPISWEIRTRLNNVKLKNANNITVYTSGGKIINNITIKEDGENSIIKINDNANPFVVRYFTQAPIKKEKLIDNYVKEITVSSSASYSNVTVETIVPEVIQLNDKDNFKLYWKEENKYLDYKVEDNDNNGIIDSINWIIPHLSEQTFIIIIFVNNSLHLNSSKTTISDITREVKELDNNWSETINDGEYVRVKFEKELSNKNDITIYPRIKSGNPRIEVYEVESSEKIAEFNSLTEYSYNKVFLTGLMRLQDSFDLKIIGGSLEFDQIIDPPTPSPYITVQRGETSSAALYLNVTLPIAVNLSSSLVLLSTRSGSSTPNILFSMGRLLTDTTLQLSKYSTTSTVNAWEVINDADFVVNANTQTYAAATTSYLINVPQVNLSSSFIVISSRLNDATAADNPGGLWAARFDNATRINISRSYTSASTAGDFYYQVVNWNNALVQNGSVTIANGQSGVTANINAINLSNSFVIFSRRTVTTSAIDTMVQGFFPSTSQVRFQRVGTTGAVIIEYFVISSPDINVQTGNYYFTGSTAIQNRPINKVNLTRTFRVNSWDFDTATTTYARAFVTLNMSNETNIQLKKDVQNNGANNTYFVVEFLYPDLIPPIVNITLPLNHTYGLPNFPLNVNVSLNEKGSIVWYSLNNWANNYSLYSLNNLYFNGSISDLNDGSYTLRVFANDSVGNVNMSAYLVFRIDKIAPLVNIIRPLSKWYNSSPIFFNVSLNENGTTWYSLTNGLTNLSMQANASSTGFNCTNYTMADGNYTIKIYANDSVGNINYTTNVSFFVDSVSPLISFGSGGENNGINVSKNWIFVNVSVIELNEANITFTLFDNYGILRNLTFTNRTRYFNFTGLIDGTYYYNVSVVDWANNRNTTMSYKITLDNSAPIINIISPINQQYLQTYIDLNVSLDEIGDICYASLDDFTTNYSMTKINSTYFNYTNFSIGKGNYTARFACNDSFGNLNMSASRNFSIWGFSVNNLSSSYTLINSQTGENLTRGTWNQIIPSRLKINEVKIAEFDINFTGDEDWSDVLAGVSEYEEYDLYYNKSFIHIPIENHSSVGNIRLFVPALIDTGLIFVCPNTSSLDQVNENCSGVYYVDGLSISNGYYNTSVNGTGSAVGSKSRLIVWDSNDSEGGAQTVFVSQYARFYANYTVRNTGAPLTGGNSHCNITFNITNEMNIPRNMTYNSSSFLYEYNRSIATAGYYTFNITCDASSLNANRLTVRDNFTIAGDIVKPNASLIYPLNYSWYNNRTQNMTINSTDNVNLVNKTIYVYNSTGELINKTTNELTGTSNLSYMWYDFPNDGNFSWHYAVVDVGNNYFTTYNYTIFIDSQFPWVSYGDGTMSNGMNVSQNYIYVNVSVIEENEMNITFTLFNGSGIVNNITLFDKTRNFTWINLDDGSYYYNISVVDVVNNKNTTESYNINLDNSKPLINIDYPNNGKIFNISVIGINYSVYDLSIASCWWTNDLGASNNSITCGDNITSAFSEGNQTVIVYANDSFGNTNYTNVSFFVDSVVPLIDYGYGTMSDGMNVSQNYIYVNVSVIEENEMNITFTLFNSSELINNITFYDKTRNFTWINLDDGSYYYNISVVDVGNNQNITQTYNINLDNSKPLINIDYPNNGKIFNISVIGINYSVYDLSIASCWWTNDLGASNNSITCGDNITSAFSEGNQTVIVYANDSFGNTNYTNVSFFVDSVVPLIDYGYGVENNGVNVTRNWVYINVSVIEENEMNITFFIYNLSGQYSYFTFLDQTREYNFTELIDGIYYYNVTIIDIGNNQNTTQSYKIMLDNTPPLISFGNGVEINDSSFERDWIYANLSLIEANLVNVTFELFNDTNGLTLINRTTFQSAQLEINWTNLSSLNISYFYRAYASDLLNQDNSTELRLVKLIDVSAPNLILNSPANTTYDTNESLSIDYSVNDVNLQSCWYHVDNDANQSLADCLGTTFGVSDGSHTIVLYANDSLGNTNRSYIAFHANSSYVLTNIFKVMSGSSAVNIQENVTTGKFDKTKSFILLNTRGSSDGANVLQVIPVVHNSTVIKLENYIGAADVEWSVVTGPGLTVQRGESIYASTLNQINITIGQVNLNKTFAIVYNKLDTGVAGRYSRGLWSGRLENSSYLILERSTSGTAGVVSWQVVQWNEANVTNGSTTMTSDSSNVDFDKDYDLNRSFVLFSRRTIETGSDDIFIGAHFFNSTRLRLYRGNAGSGNVNVDWFIISSPILRIESGSTNVGALLNINQTINKLVNESRTFIVMGYNNSGTTTGYSDAHITSKLTNDTNIEFKKDVATSSGITYFFSVEIVDIISPVVNLIYPTNNTIFSDFLIMQFNYTVEDNNTIVNCSLIGNWSDNLAINQTESNPLNNYSVEQNFSIVDLGNDGYYQWNVICVDAYNNYGMKEVNFSFGAFKFPDYPRIINVSLDTDDGTGNITIYWENAAHAKYYRVYFNESLRNNMTIINQTTRINITDSGLKGKERGYYMISSWNPTGENRSIEIVGNHLYTLNRKENGNTKNWIAFPTNASYLTYANESLLIIKNISSITMFNETRQKRVTCNNYTCPSYPSCTDTNCNFNLLPGRSYEANLNTSAPTEVNWSMAGIVYPPQYLNLTKNSTSFGKNWISLYANSTTNYANNLLDNIPNADGVTYWDARNQISKGLLKTNIPGFTYMGNNYSLKVENGYEISVSANVINWLQY